MFRQEAFYGFDMTDNEVGPGQWRAVAVELKHAFEGIAADADRKNEEILLPPELEHALRRLLVDPCQASLDYLLEVSPALIEPTRYLQTTKPVDRETGECS